MPPLDKLVPVADTGSRGILDAAPILPNNRTKGRGCLDRQAADPRRTRGRTRCNIETIRYYERVGLLPPPPRSVGGHRLYAEGLVRRLNFVRRSRDLGFSIEEIRELLRLVDGGT